MKWKPKPHGGKMPDALSKPDVGKIVSELSGIPEEDLLNDTKDYNIEGVRQAADMIKKTIASHRKVFVMGDYDADGICASAIMYMLVRALGGYVVVRLPKRMSEGYGLNEAIVDEFEDGALLVTVDNGISAAPAIRKAKAKGMTVVLTDHHLPPEDGMLPEADLIIDPNAGTPADFTGYCGAGLAYRIAKEALGEEASKSSLPVAAIATVADVMPLTGENRRIVKQGLSLITSKEYTTAGLRALLRALSLTDNVSATDVGFFIGPALNAPGRLLDDGASKSLSLLLFNGRWQDADAKAAELIDLNAKRKEYCKAMLEKAESIISEKHMKDDVPMIVALTEKPDGVETIEGIVGNIAGELAERYSTPTIVLTTSEEKPGVLKGSARGKLDVNLKELLDKNAKWLLGYGGHRDAAGLSLEARYLEDFRKDALAACKDVERSDADEIFYDIAVSPKDFPGLVEEIASFAPYGTGVPAPIVMIENVEALPSVGEGGARDYYRLMGGGSTVKFRTEEFDAIGFGLGEKTKEFRYNGKRMSFVGTASKNWFRGTARPQIECIDLQENRPPARPTALQSKLFQIAKGGQNGSI